MFESPPLCPTGGASKVKNAIGSHVASSSPIRNQRRSSRLPTPRSSSVIAFECTRSIDLDVHSFGRNSTHAHSEPPESRRRVKVSHTFHRNCTQHVKKQNSVKPIKANSVRTMHANCQRVIIGREPAIEIEAHFDRLTALH